MPRLTLLPLAAALGLLCAPVHSEDLLDAFRQAVANDPVLATAQATQRVTAAGVPIARSALLPQVSATLGLTQYHGGDGSTTSTGGTGNIIDTGAGGHVRERAAGVSLQQPIINLPNIANLRAAQSARDSQDETERAALQALYVRVATAYFNVLIAEDELDVAKSYEDAYKQEFDQSTERFADGLAAASDVAQSRAYYHYIKSQRVSSETALKDANRALQQITGQTTPVLKRLKEDMPMELPVPNDAKAWVDAAMQSNPNILAANHTVDADEHRVNAARAGHAPTLGLGVGYNKYGSWSNVRAGAAGYGPGTTSIGLNLTIPIFSGGLTQAQVHQAIGQRDADAGLLETQRRQAARDALNYYNQIVDGVDQVASARDAVDAAGKALESMRAGNDIGTQSLTNVVVAIQLLAEAKSEYTVVRHNFVLNHLLLKQAAGTIELKDLEDVNRLLQ
ncbi:outer membrane protein [Luteibacter sp. Sphag1AF]|uniref:TolC family outer membrane protein n=1 Tax=Luteibacter sp. Sphag1AF TaxID=2587031 RepID=UPI00161AF833|nr:TolC family outer membrane protein [Luteibacter sp. Sphag1AF]MBB3226815.1 outer membrane protein [Luteibacter sp. Sphag1AF]